MQWNKSASLLAVPSLLLGSVGAIGLPAHARQSPATNPPAQIQTRFAAVSEQANSSTDKDNIKVKGQKNNGRPELVLEQEDGDKAKDGIEADGNLPGGGHQDQDGANADHQFEGVE